MVEESSEFLLLKREAETNRKLYETLLIRLKETTVTENIPQSNIHVVDEGQIPDFPVRPRKRMNILLSMIMGSMLGVGLAFFFEYLDNTIKGPEDIDKVLGIPFLGPIPSATRGGSDRSIDLVVLSAPKSSHSEAYRAIRAGLLLSMADHPPKKILITSPGILEGKTTTAANLAVAMAQAGNSTLLIDADLRKPRLHRLFDQDNSKGLSTLLVGESTFEVTLRQTQVPLLSILSSGPIPPNPAELLGSQKMRDVLSEASKRFDRIILDTPPVGPVSDALSLATMCDGVVFIIRESQTSKELAAISKKRLADANAKFLGVVLNDVKRLRHGYYYLDYYHEEGEDENLRREV